jgi:hypothetical protein
MGTMTFQLPAGLPADAVRELERTCIVGGPDNMPWPTEVHFRDGHMSVRRAVDESGNLVVPWPVEHHGLLLGTSATLMERQAPYDLVIELARGKVNQVRNQVADWRAGGLQLPPDLQQQIHELSLLFGRAVTAGAGGEGTRLAQTALELAYRAADAVVRAYVEQVFHIRHQRQERLETGFGCRLGPAVPDGPAAQALGQAWNAASVPMSWHAVESEEASYRWEASDALLAWAAGQGLEVTAGPLIDFSSAQLPAWLWLWERDVPSLATFMCKFVEAAVRRYRTRVRRWHLTAASNWASVLSLGEDELLGLTYRLGETARQVDPSLELVVGVAQPWGEYMATADRTHSPFVFADTLIRSGLNLAALEVEAVMGVSPRGSYCRDLLELSRLLDLYALLGVPLQVTLGYPSDAAADPDADPELRVGGGSWAGGFSPATQADWATACSALAVCKPYVRGVSWCHWSDAAPHQFPHCGLLDRDGRPKPALDRLTDLRTRHLR